MKFIVILTMALTCSFCLAGPLDQPATTPVPTVRTEIMRGSKAVTLRFDNTRQGLFKMRDAFNTLINQNKTMRTNTDAFALGAYYEYWRQASISLKVYKDSFTPSETNIGRAIVEASYNTFRQKQKSLGISDQAFAEALEIPPGNRQDFIQSLANPFSITGD